MYYCILLILSYVNLFFRNKLNVKQAIDYVAQSWSEVTSITIQNCWHKTDILPHTQELEIQELELPSVTNILGNLPANTQALVQNIEDYIIAIDEPLATENILEDIEIVDMVLADAQIEAGTIKDSEEELEESPPAVITITEAYEALKKIIRFEEQLVEESFSIENRNLLRKRLYDYEKMQEKSKKQVTIDQYFRSNTNI
jgi:hypothetical protein